MNRCTSIYQTDMVNNDQKLFEVRRFVAVVPFRSGVLDGSAVLMNALVNAAVLLFWFGGAAVFTILRIGMRFANLSNDGGDRLKEEFHKKTTIYFDCLARVLGNSSGCEQHFLKTESFLLYVIGIFATLTSMLFTSALFEQMIAIEPPKQIDTMAELIASNTKIIVCSGDVYILEG